MRSYAKVKYEGHSPDPADYWWEVSCPAGSIGFSRNAGEEAKACRNLINAAYMAGKLDAYKPKRPAAPKA